MTRFLVFNGDADGLCALQQLHLAESAPQAVQGADEATPDAAATVRITGAKRDIALLARVDAHAGDSVTVLDVSVDTNRDALLRLLARGVRVQWFDHHHAGVLPVHPAFDAHVDTDPERCTSLIVDTHLAGLGRRHARWAVAGAFGDNLDRPARALADAIGLDAAQQAALRTLGRAINHNAYADDEAELLVHPLELSALIAPYEDPLAFAAHAPAAAALAAMLHDDLARADACAPTLSTPGADVFVLADAPWARRVRGSLGNLLAGASPGRALAIVVPRVDGAYTVSLRVPAGTLPSADAFCRGHPTGGGRSIAAGIDRVPASALDDLIRTFVDAYGGAS